VISCRLSLTVEPEMLNSGLIGLAAMSEDIQTHFSNDYNNLMTLLTPLIQSYSSMTLPNQYALLSLLGILSQEYTPVLQNNYHSLILPHIIL
jgi:hypothetical protein